MLLAFTWRIADFRATAGQVSKEMNQRTVFFVSDQTGITAETLGRSLLTQFENVKFRQVTVPFIATIDKAREAVAQINLVAKVEGVRPIVFSTLVQDELREILRRADGLFLDFIDAFIGPLEREIGMKSSHRSGRAHGIADNSNYTRRIDAMNFALANDDGATTAAYEDADVILVGVSRSGKTPTCLYLALQFGVSPANYPLTGDELDGNRLPRALRAHRHKLFGLTIEPERLCEIRTERRPDSQYCSPQQVDFEVRAAEGIFRSNGIPFVDTTRSSIEEIASTVLSKLEIERQI